MKNQVVDANFPRTLDQRVYHLGIRPGEVANRIITLGSPSRARGVASYLDATPLPFSLTSERGFTTITGRYKSVPVSVVSIGMGYPNADFFVREARECLAGDMLVVRLGSCGALIDVPVGSVVAPRGSIAVTRNYDFDFVTGNSRDGPPYRTSKPVMADPVLHSAVVSALRATRPANINTPVVDHTLNASADSFYASQGRQTSFPDHNADLVARLVAEHKDLGTLEMETFHIFHLAACWRVEAAHDSSSSSSAAAAAEGEGGGVGEGEAKAPSGPPPVQHAPTASSIGPTHAPSAQTTVPHYTPAPAPAPAESSSVAGGRAGPACIRAAAAQMVFASRVSQAFITPQEVAAVEAWTGLAVLEALAGLVIEPDRLHDEAGSVWEIKERDLTVT